ncbi:MAG: hypothetical protein ACRCWO_12015 [Bosea sp. (in: a-proteobacteria)]
MTNAAGNTFIWNQNNAAQGEMPALPQLSNPHEVAERLFAELGLDRYLEKRAAKQTSLIETLNTFADETAEEVPAAASEQAPAQDTASAKDAIGTVYVATEADLDATSGEDGYFIEVPFMTDETYEQEGTWLADKADMPIADMPMQGEADASWLGVDPSAPREWTAQDLMMLIYHDRSHVSDAAAQLADLPEYDAYGEADADEDYADAA